MDAITTPPAPVNEPHAGLRPRQPRAGHDRGRARPPGRPPARPDRHHRRARRCSVGARRSRWCSRTTHASVLGVLKNATKRDAQAAVKAAADAAPGWRAMSFDDRAAILLKAADLLAGPWRARLNAATMLGQSKTVWQAEIDCGLRADRLLALQRALRAADPRRAADREQSRDLEPHRPPAAGGLRLRDHAVQLHRDRRQPADRARADGQHRHLEAVADPAARRAPDHGAAGGGRAAARCDQHAPRRRPRGLRRAAGPPRPRGHPLHRLDADLPQALGHGGERTCRRTAPTRGSWARPAARTSSSRTPRPTSTCCGWR